MTERIRDSLLNLTLLILVITVPLTVLWFTDVPSLVADFRPEWLTSWITWMWWLWGAVGGLLVLAGLGTTQGRWLPLSGRLAAGLLHHMQAWFLRSRVPNHSKISSKALVPGNLFPPLELLGPPSVIEVRPCPETAQHVRVALTALGVPGCEVIKHYTGPVVKIVHLRIPDATRASTVIALSGDLAAYLGARSVVVRPLVGTPGVLQVEVAEREVVHVSLRSLLDTREFRRSDGVPLILGAGGMGAPLVTDLTRLPHLLIAGSTGAGKTTVLRGMLIGMVYRLSPADLRLLLIDPKLVEFTPFRGLPHLLRDVITVPMDARDALANLVDETQHRYRLFQQAEVNDIATYNRNRSNHRLPYIVAIVDELAVLMESQMRREIEAAIQSLGQLARAAGIHLILATQRPSVDVVTGLVKANIPGRISLRLASQADSRTIIDGAGAEQLRGRGDLLFRPESDIIRAQAAWVPVELATRVVKWWRQSTPGLLDPWQVPQEAEIADIETYKEDSKCSLDQVVERPLSRDEVETRWVKERVLETGEISRRIVERGLGISSARANSLVNMVDELGWLHPPRPPQPRKIKLDPERCQALLQELRGLSESPS